MVAFSLALGGCTSVKVQATKDVESVRRLERLFLLINHGDMGNQPYSTNLANHFRMVLSNPPPVLEIGIVSPLELDEKVHQIRVEQFKADAVLVVRLTGAVLSQYGGYPVLTYDASLFDPPMKKRMWRGVVNNSGGTGLMNRRMREMAEALVAQLRKDGFL